MNVEIVVPNSFGRAKAIYDDDNFEEDDDPDYQDLMLLSFILGVPTAVEAKLNMWDCRTVID